MLNRARFSKVGRGVVSLGFAGALVLGGAVPAFAAATNPFGTTPSGTVTPNANLIKTYGVRAGSAGADYLGITNTNYDFTAGSASATTQYTGYTSYANNASDNSKLAGLSIWGSSVNESVNPYYANLLYYAVNGTSAVGQQNAATTWMKNSNSWGDSFATVTEENGTYTVATNSTKNNTASGAATVNGLEYNPQIIFGANKVTNWDNLTASETVFGKYLANNESGYNPEYVANDATNIWTQVYTMGQLATTADGLKSNNSGLVTRYDSNNAKASAISYEKAIRGNLLYIASRIDANSALKKTVAYLYAIDANGVGYFFVPTAAGLLSGNDTGKKTGNAYNNPDANYAANNSTINMGYMATLPFVTNTFNSGHAFTTTTVWNDQADPNGDGKAEGADVSGVNIPGIVMKVEDIYKASPACTVGSSDTNILSNVDVIIYNTNTNTVLENGTSGGKNLSSVNNDYQGTRLTASKVRTWAQNHGLSTSASVIAGDDFGTSSAQGFGTDDATANCAPMLYCQRNYTADKNARAAWAFSKVYPNLYGNNSNASYAYWVNKVYHVSTASVPTVAGYLTNQSASAVTYTSTTASTMENYFRIGLNWWNNTGKNKAAWNQFNYYNGSSRASYYVDVDESSYDPEKSDEPLNTIGIFTPTLWGSN